MKDDIGKMPYFTSEIIEVKDDIIEVKDDTSKLREEMEKNDRRTRHDIYLLFREQRELERSLMAEKKFVRTCIAIFAGAIVGVFMLCLLIGR